MLVCIARDLDENTATTKPRAFRNFHQLAKLLKNCCCCDEVLVMTMTSIGSELAVYFHFSLKSFPLDLRHVGLSNLHHTP